MLGGDPQKAIDAISKELQTSKYNAGRLVMTEEAYFNSVAQKEMFDRLGATEYEIVATLDSRTSEICQKLDGQHFPVKDYQAGVTAPPFHVFCRSTTVPYFEDDFVSSGERAAKDENGDTYYVPADMTYQKWKETFVDDGDKSALQSIANLGESGIINLTDDEQYAINSYISSGSYVVNEKLRSGLKLTADETKFVADLETALDKMPKYSGNLSRSVYFDDSEKLATYIEQHKVGSTVTYEAFTSTTKGSVYNEKANVQIYIKNAKSGADISKYNVSEQEILYKTNSSFVVGKVKNIRGTFYIYLKEN
ncbi:MAG: minor capsid protein [Clostridiales bacterium]|nr:minor capsid protein [Clostridiales bacterium]